MNDYRKKLKEKSHYQAVLDHLYNQWNGQAPEISFVGDCKEYLELPNKEIFDAVNWLKNNRIVVSKQQGDPEIFDPLLTLIEDDLVSEKIRQEKPNDCYICKLVAREVARRMFSGVRSKKNY